MKAIEVNGLVKEFDTTTAVNNISFTVNQGEIFGLLGPNGAGKSTLINILVTLLDSTSGTAMVNGYEVSNETSKVRDSIGIVFQEPAVDEELTGEENLAFHGRMYGKTKSEREKRIPEVLDLVDLADEADNPVKNYSGGMRRRLEIGRGLMHEPDVLFLDEPTTGLDARTRRDTWEYIQQLNEEAGVTISITTHYMDEADFLCDRVAVMDQGDIVAIDTPTELKNSLGGDVITLDIDGAQKELFDRLDDQQWVRKYRATDTGIAVTMEEGETHVADLVRLVDRTGASISSVDLRKPTLENVFLSLTGSTMAERESDAEASDDANQNDPKRGQASEPQPERPMEVGE